VQGTRPQRKFESYTSRQKKKQVINMSPLDWLDDEEDKID